MMMDFETVARLASPADNVAIATCRIDAGTVVLFQGIQLKFSHTVLEGHRFALQPLQPGDMLTSWGQPFGKVLTDIQPGDYICNEAAFRELSRRSPDFMLPAQANFADEIAPFIFDESTFRPGADPIRYDDTLAFEGYRRPGQRGTGTRNMIVLLGTSSLTGGFVRVLETQLKPLATNLANLDGIVAAAHTEGGTQNPNNRDLLLRTLAGLVVHPNVGAILIVDRGTEVINNAVLRDYMEQHHYVLGDVIHQFMTLSGSFQEDIQSASETVKAWLEPVTNIARTTQPVSELKIALQCGGSDAFSGISGNPLAAWVAKEIVRNGGSANLAETDELIGAEPYMLSNMRDIATARKFLHFIERFKAWAGRHGETADGNPSGGNLYRGLYNIYLKSLGAAAKRHPDVRVDAVIDYAEPMRESGFYFMDSPGNDLESVAGQIAAGCNMIFFVTGNGSVTNFPFVPTIKIVTTSERYRLLPNEMDVNAGAYFDGMPFEELGQSTLQLTIDAASGQLTAGERAGHAQLQIWRDWPLTDSIPVDRIPVRHRDFSREPLPIHLDIDVPEVRFPALRVGSRVMTEQVGLILPTSLCSGQVARMTAEALNQQGIHRQLGISRFVTLIHTEGCGASVGRELHDTLLGYLTHPMVSHALLLEHGCEKTHNGYIRQIMFEREIDPARFGWASVQLDGGIQKVIKKIADWFTAQPTTPSEPVMVGLEALCLGLMSQGEVSEPLARQLATLTRLIVAAGGTVIVPENDPLFLHRTYQQELGFGEARPTLGYAQSPQSPGFHVMEMPTRSWGEMLTGLGAAGSELIVTHTDQQPLSGHPMIPTLQVTSYPAAAAAHKADLDGFFESNESGLEQLLDLMIAALGRNYVPQTLATGNTDFLITRGVLGVSL